MKVILFFLLLLSDPVMALTGENFDFNLYMRNGIGRNDKGGAQTCIYQNGAPANQFRLGNECSNYSEFTFSGHSGKSDLGPSYKAQITYFQKPSNNNQYASPNFQKTEAFIEMGNIEGTSNKYWVGTRYYDRKSIWMNDLFYLDMGGTGAGVYDVKLGNLSKLNIAYYRQSGDSQGASGIYSSDVVDLRVTEFKLSEKITLNLFSGYGQTAKTNKANSVASNASAATSDVVGTKGYYAGVEYLHNVGIFSNNATVLYGKGFLKDFGIGSAYVSESTSSNQYNVSSAKKKSTIRLIDHGMANFTKEFETQYAFIYQISNNGQPTNSKTIWSSFGLTPVYHFTDVFSVMGQTGFSTVKADGSSVTQLMRLTVAPQLTPQMNFFARPSLRFFVSWTKWNKGLNESGKTVVANGGDNFFAQNDYSYTKRTSVTNIGFQGEIWF